MGWRGQQHPTANERIATFTVGEQAEVTDADQTARQDMDQEASQELMCRNRHDLLLAAMSIVAPEKRDAIFVECDDPMVGDGHAMGVAGQVLQHLIRPAEGRLGIDHPVAGEQCPQKAVKSVGTSELLKRAVELELVGSVQVSEDGCELAAEETAKRHDRQEEAF